MAEEKETKPKGDRPEQGMKDRFVDSKEPTIVVDNPKPEKKDEKK